MMSYVYRQKKLLFLDSKYNFTTGQLIALYGRHCIGCWVGRTTARTKEQSDKPVIAEIEIDIAELFSEAGFNKRIIEEAKNDSIIFT